MLKRVLLIIISFSSVLTFATGTKIKVYFNQAVNTSFSRGTNAVYLNNTMDDTLVAYISRAKYSLDIAIYQLSQSSGMADVVGALNAAATRGVTVRIIYDGKDNASTSISSLSSSIHKLASPSTSSYNIMHNKFMIIDGNSTSSTDALVWTGSTNWSLLMFQSDYNNTVILQDQPLAQAYIAEFNQMWGSTTATPNATNSKFGPFKTATTAHSFTIDGHHVELYFSPSDATNNQIVNTISTADKELFFGVYTFTESPNASGISAKYSTSGITVKGIMDNYSTGYSAYAILNPVMGTDLKIYNHGGTTYHNKMMIVDPDYPTMDPLVLTGSHNWSVTADTKNDENILIIHDSTTANLYLQSFAQNFIALGGSITPLHVNTGIENTLLAEDIKIYPNPTQNTIHIEVADNEQRAIEITDITGKVLYATTMDGSNSTISLQSYDTGVYFVKMNSTSYTHTYRVVKW